MVMDVTHIIEHSRWNPYCMKTMRSWHAHHHKKQNWEFGHDMIFGTLPTNWILYETYPSVKYFGHLPFPMIGFILITPWLKCVENKPNGNIQYLLNQTTSQMNKLKFNKLSFALLFGIILGCSPWYFHLFQLAIKNLLFF